ncbi:drug/metabolite transporter (DMT)-like permease [Bradyrhizobium sp. USDA 336]
MFTLFAASRVPIANVQAILCSHGALILLFAVAIDRESVSWHHIVTIALAVSGAILVADPVTSEANWYNLAGYGAAAVASACWATEVFLFRNAAKHQTTILTMLIVNLFGLLVLTVPGYYSWRAVSMADALTLTAMGPLAVSAQFAQLAALKRAPLTIVAPFRYANVLFAAALGIAFLNQIPDGQAITGFVLIIASAIYIYVRTIAHSKYTQSATPPLKER